MNNFISRDDFTCLVVIGLSSGLHDKFFNLFVQAFGFHQLFQSCKESMQRMELLYRCLRTTSSQSSGVATAGAAP